MAKAKRRAPPAAGEAAFLCLICHRAFRSGWEVHEHYSSVTACRKERDKMTRADKAVALRENAIRRKRNGWTGQKHSRTNNARKLHMEDLVIEQHKLIEQHKPAVPVLQHRVEAPGLIGWSFCPHCGADIKQGSTS